MAGTLSFTINWHGGKATAGMALLGHQAQAAAKQINGANDAGKSWTKGLTGLGAKLGGILKPVAAAASTTAGVGAAAVPAALGVTKLAAAAAHLGAAIAPAAASLPAVAGGLLFLKATVTSTGPAMAKAFSPVTDAFAHGQKEVDQLATKGLPSLAKGFVRVNFPSIHEAMTEIADAQNGIVTGVGKWINSTHGQEAIRSTVLGISGAVSELRPEITQLAISFGELVRRDNGRGIDILATGFQRAATGAKRFLDGISSEDISRAWGAVEGFASRLAGFGKVVLDVGNYLNDNRAKVTGFSDALAGVGIALGILSGNPIGVLLGALTLLVNHWDQVKGAVSGVVTWFQKSTGATSAVSGAMSVLRGIAGDLSSWFTGKLLPALQSAGSDLMPTLRTAASDVSDAFRDNKDALDKARGIFDALGVVLTRAVIPALTIAAKVAIPAVTGAFTGMLTVINKVVLPGIRIFTKLALDQFGGLINGAAEAFGWIPGIGDKLKTAAGKFNAFRDEVNRALNGIHDHQVNVTINTRYKNYGTPAGTVVPEWYGKRAAGGPVLMGKPYLVGEQGPELFMPSRNGRIIPAQQTASLMDRAPVGAPLRTAGNVYNVTVHVHGSALASRTELETLVVRALDSAAAKGQWRRR